MREILRLALPSILANITIPLVGIVDLAIAGHISDASAMGGIAVGTMLFDLLYWNFGFLRAGTGGMTAQAWGRDDAAAVSAIFRRNVGLALGGAVLLLLVGWVFVDIVMMLMPHSAEVEQFARAYYNVRIWAAPATLSLMVFKGWFIGCQNAVAPMMCDITVNVVNMAASYALAVYTPLGALGVAYGTLIAQYAGVAVAVVAMAVKYRGYLGSAMAWTGGEKHSDAGLQADGAMGWRSIVSLNWQLFLRSLGMMVVYVGFTSLTSAYGDMALAVGAIMMKLFMVFSYFVDGFAYAGEALVGKYIGCGNRAGVVASVRRLFLWGAGIGVAFTLLFVVADEQMVGIMTSDASVIESSRPYLFWLAAMPLVSCAAFLWDGIYIGATAGRQIRDCMLLAAVGFVFGYVCLQTWLGLQAVYIAYFIHLLVRTGYLSLRWPKTLRRVFG